MVNLILALWCSYKTFLSGKAANATTAWSSQDKTNFIIELVLLLLAVSAPIAGVAVLLLVAYQLRKSLLLLAMIPVLLASYEANHPSGKREIDDGDGEKTPYEKALELYPVVLRFVFQVMRSASSRTIIDCKHDMRDIMVTSPANNHFSMKNGVAIYPFEVDIGGEIAQEQVDKLREDLQQIGKNHINDFPQLISSEAGKADPFEILSVQPIGKRIHVDVVLTTSASLPIIDKCRKARVTRQNNPTPPPRYTDPIYVEEEDGTDRLLR